MSKRSKPRRQSRRHSQERRRRLHAAVDRILDGPDRGDVDQWVVQTLSDIGLILRAAALAVDYEIGRVIAGTDRPHGYFPDNLSWRGAHLAPHLQQADDWMVAGKAARKNLPPSETQQRALAALLRPIANIHATAGSLISSMRSKHFRSARCCPW